MKHVRTRRKILSDLLSQRFPIGTVFYDYCLALGLGNRYPNTNQVEVHTHRSPAKVVSVSTSCFILQLTLKIN